MSDVTGAGDTGPGAAAVAGVLAERPGPTAELYQFELWSPSAPEALALRVELCTLPAEGHAWFSAHLFRPGQPLVTLTERAPLRCGLELRAPGLWADHNIEIPFEHWSLSLEAFALEVDRPTDARGVRVPLGFELDWEMEPTQRRATVGGYEQPARVRGELLVSSERYEIDTPGWRAHSLVAALPADARHHGTVAGPGAAPRPVWSGPGDEPVDQPWGWALSDLPFGTLLSGPWSEGDDPNVAGFAERWSPAP